MKTHLFYFSATGNSLKIANDLAKELGETRVFSIPKVIHETPDLSAERIGIVFPMYYGGIPNIVKRFIGTITPEPGKYLFAVTSGRDENSPMGALDLARKLFRKKGLDLSAGFFVRMPGNYLLMYDIISKEEQEDRLKEEEARVREIAGKITAGERSIEKGSFLANWLLSGVMHGIASSRFATADKYLRVDEKCTHCGTCEKVCPVRNIRLRDGVPTWLHHCEHCLACLHWCPAGAIQCGKNTAGRTRYRNPRITLEDLT